MESIREVWKIVPNYPNYEVSNVGRVRSIRKMLVMRPINRKGYRVVKLGHPDIAFGIHQLVAWAFIGPQVEGLVVNHKDGNKHNNVPENLEYLTNLENIRHAYDNGLMRNKGERNGKAQLTKDQVREIKFGDMTAKDAAEKFGVKKHVVWQIRSGTNWKHVTPSEG